MRLLYPAGATPLDPNEIEGLIPNIAVQSELNAHEEDNIVRARRWALSPRNRKLKDGILSTDKLQLLHEKMFEDVWKWAGIFRRTEKNIGVPWLQIAIELHNLCEDVNVQLQHKSLPLDECAVRFHHRLVSIHPFPNGNGRHARLATDILVIKNDRPEFSWGRHLSHDPDAVRKAYIDALRSADKGDVAPLLKFART